MAVSALLILINCPHDTAFLNSVLFWRCWELQGAGAAEPHRTFFSSWPKHWLSNFLILQPMKGPCRNVLLRFRKFPNALETFKIFTCAKYPDIFSTDCTIIKKAFSPHSALRSLSKDDDDGSENVSKNMNSRPFKLYRAYLDPLNVGDFSWSWILWDFFWVQKEKGKFVIVCSRPS